MAVMQLKVVPVTGDPVVVPITPKVIVSCERHFKKGMAQLFDQANVSYEALAYAAWEGMRLAGHEVKLFDAWLDGIDEIGTEESAPSPLSEP
jgi:hypothetical protein